MTKDNRHILLVDDDLDFVRRIETILQTDSHQKYSLIWRRNGDEALKEAEQNAEIDLILMEYFLPDQTGLEVARRLYDLKIRKPIIFLTINKDFDIVVELMKFGVKKYVVKDEVSSTILSKIITKVLEQHHLEEELLALEITKQRLEAMRELVSRVLMKIEQPTLEMQGVLERWNALSKDKEYQKFLNIIKANVFRIMTKIERLRSLNTDKTVKYINDIRMIDLS